MKKIIYCLIGLILATFVSTGIIREIWKPIKWVPVASAILLISLLSALITSTAIYYFLERRESSLHKRFSRLESKLGLSLSDGFKEMYEKMGLLFFDPTKKEPADSPRVDKITRKFVWLWHRRERMDAGFFSARLCSCGQRGNSYFYLLPVPNKSNFLMTNSMALHYLVWHRGEIPEAEIKKILEITSGIPEEEPTIDDLAPPICG